MATYITFVEVSESDRPNGFLEPAPNVTEEMEILAAVEPTRESHAVRDGYELIGKTLKHVANYRGIVIYVEGGHRFTRTDYNMVYTHAERPRHGELEKVRLYVNGHMYDAVVQYKIVRE